MKNKSILVAGLTIILLLLNTWAGDFFSIEKIDFYKKPPRKNPPLLKETPTYDKAGKLLPIKERIFTPTFSVEVKTDDQIRSETTFAKVYFYGNDHQLIATTKAPSPLEKRAAMPVFFERQKGAELFFPAPDKVLQLNEKDWSAVIVFGDKQGAVAKGWPDLSSLVGLEYPEKNLVEKKEITKRKAAIDPVVEQVVKTGNPKYDKLTLFMRPPKGITEGKDVQGVMAMCFLANDPEEIRQILQGKNSYGYAMEFADKNKLAIIGWGSRRLWDPSKSWDEQNKGTNKVMDESFDDIAKAWSKGVEEFVKKYGIPEKDYLLWGISGAAQFSCRLALREPDYFLAIHAHIPSSFDQPSLEANRILWCLTTGELESGYERSLRFYANCRELGYPMVYKAIIGLGHSGSPLADNLGLKFFQYALSVRAQRDAYDATLKDTFLQKQNTKPEMPLQPWLESFRTPEFVGDIVNQEMFPAAQVDQVSAGFRVSLPTKEIAEAWNKK